MAKIPKNLADKAMFAGVKEEETFETMLLSDDSTTNAPKRKIKAAEKEDLATAFLTKELQEKIGRELLALKLELYKKGLVEYDIKVIREGDKIILSAVPNKHKTK